MAILYRVLSWIHALILYFSDINAPRVGSRRGTAHGAALLTKWGETAMMKTERAPLLAVGFPYQLIIIMLTVQLPLGGQHAFMDSARAKMTTHTKNLQGNLSTPASPPFHLDFARGEPTTFSS